MIFEIGKPVHTTTSSSVITKRCIDNRKFTGSGQFDRSSSGCTVCAADSRYILTIYRNGCYLFIFSNSPLEPKYGVVSSIYYNISLKFAVSVGQSILYATRFLASTRSTDDNFLSLFYMASGPDVTDPSKDKARQFCCLTVTI